MARSKKSPVRQYRQMIDDSGNPSYVNRVLVGTATTGLVRIEWVGARYGQLIPANWSMVQYTHFMSSYIPIHYQVADAQNVIVKEAIEKDFEWLLLWEHDTIPPEDAIMKMNKYMRDERVPVVSGLYFTRSVPSEPLVYRGRGTSYYKNWKLGDKVWVDGVPTGFLLIHMGIIREMWKDSPEYMAGNNLTRRVFELPQDQWFDAAQNKHNLVTGTTDLNWCTRVMEGGYFKKAGWDEYQNKRYPFLIDTSILCKHIDQDGTTYPQELKW